MAKIWNWCSTLMYMLARSKFSLAYRWSRDINLDASSVDSWSSSSSYTSPSLFLRFLLLWWLNILRLDSKKSWKSNLVELFKWLKANSMNNNSWCVSVSKWFVYITRCVRMQEFYYTWYEKSHVSLLFTLCKPLRQLPAVVMELGTGFNYFCN